MADAKVSKTFGPKDHEGSTPSLGTLTYAAEANSLVSSFGLPLVFSMP